MIPEENNPVDQDDLANTDNDKMQDAGNADAAKFNADEQERLVNARETDTYQNAESADAGSAVAPDENDRP